MNHRLGISGLKGIYVRHGQPLSMLVLLGCFIEVTAQE
jgi:hypothetical protein